MTAKNRNPGALAAAGARKPDQAGGLIGSDIIGNSREGQHSLAVTVGLAHAGEVIEHPGGRYAAADSEGRILGIFPNERAATDCLLAARQGAS